jgi:hypothetical protein
VLAVVMVEPALVVPAFNRVNWLVIVQPALGVGLIGGVPVDSK